MCLAAGSSGRSPCTLMMNSTFLPKGSSWPEAPRESSPEPEGWLCAGHDRFAAMGFHHVRDLLRVGRDHDPADFGCFRTPQNLHDRRQARDMSGACRAGELRPSGRESGRGYWRLAWGSTRLARPKL